MRKVFTTIFAVTFSTLLMAADSTFYFRTSDSVKLLVRVAGTGKPCVFVHGGPGSTSYYFEALQAASLIERHMQMIYFDQRGCGRSDSAASNDYTLQRLEKDIEELKMALGFRQWMVMGHSFGGIIITNYAHDYPQSVAALMMVHGTVNMQASMGSHLDFGLTELELKDQSAFRDSTMPLQERVWKVHDKLTEKNLWYKLMFRNPFEKQLSDSITFSIGQFNRDFANKVWNVSDYWKDFSQLTSSIYCPVLVITGDKDYAIGPQHYKNFRFPKQNVAHYIGGHASFQEEPQWFSEKVISFVNAL
jgi:proline iminopeptidase